MTWTPNDIKALQGMGEKLFRRVGFTTTKDGKTYRITQRLEGGKVLLERYWGIHFEKIKVTWEELQAGYGCTVVNEKKNLVGLKVEREAGPKQEVTKPKKPKTTPKES